MAAHSQQRLKKKKHSSFKLGVELSFTLSSSGFVKEIQLILFEFTFLIHKSVVRFRYRSHALVPVIIN